MLVRRKAEADAAGEVVEDFAVLTEAGGTGYEWAPAHRWAIVLDDSRLIFADSEDLTIDPSSGRPAEPGWRPSRSHPRGE